MLDQELLGWISRENKKRERISSPPQNPRDDPLTILKLLLVILRSELRSLEILMPWASLPPKTGLHWPGSSRLENHYCCARINHPQNSGLLDRWEFLMPENPSYHEGFFICAKAYNHSKYFSELKCEEISSDAWLILIKFRNDFSALT